MANSAFTLIELLLVLVILGVLAAIVVPKLAGRSEDAKIKAAAAEISILGGALDTFEVDNGRYPTTEEGLRALVERPANAENWRPYLKGGVPVDPWKRPYGYSYPGSNNPESFDLYSLGPDGREGGDDITNWER
ncbi:MAG TPA: type II secretion system major pseudopilin GspG [Tepidisphaeraceae bacterium]|nr:type II secretion system major pseudopilin GspG [Tepidisphaeraceae bacterium]